MPANCQGRAQMLLFEEMTTELLVILGLVLTNGLFAGAELAVLGVRGTLLQQRANRRDPRALAVKALRDQPERFLATVQIGITVVSTAAAAFGGASIARSLTPVLEPLFGAYANDVAIVAVIIGISILSLILGELVPKSLALRYAEVYAFFVSRPLLVLARISAPLVWFLTASSNLVLRMFGDRTSFVESRMSRDELRQLVSDAAKAGSVDPSASEIASRALELEDVAVAEVMVRRENIDGIPHEASDAELQRIVLEEGHTRMPVFDHGDPDQIRGYVLARDVLAMGATPGLVVLDDITRPLIHVPTTAKVTHVLRQLQAKSTQIALVVDEDGGVAGLVTLEDLMEELVGDIRDEDELPVDEVTIQPDGSALVPGWIPIRKVNRALALDLPIAQHSTTIAGLCLALALAIPSIGTRLRARDGTVLEIVDASPRRVRMVRVVQPSREDKDRGAPDDNAAG